MAVLCRNNYLLVHIPKRLRQIRHNNPSAATDKHVKRCSAATDRRQCCYGSSKLSRQVGSPVDKEQFLGSEATCGKELWPKDSLKNLLFCRTLTRLEWKTTCANVFVLIFRRKVIRHGSTYILEAFSSHQLSSKCLLKEVNVKHYFRQFSHNFLHVHLNSQNNSVKLRGIRNLLEITL